jgi:hypothetical protein
MEKIEKISDYNKEKNPVVFLLDVVLSQDGLLFLKDSTHPAFNETYLPVDFPANDYTKNVPMPRIFKMGLHYITSLFHANYHHPDEHDAFLPVSNIHPIRASRNLTKLVGHQIDAFLLPVVKVKRDLYNKWNVILCEPNGILQYLRSLINIFEQDGFIEKEDYDQLRNSIDIQIEEYRVRAHNYHHSLEGFLSQDNVLARIIFSVAILSGATVILNFLLGIDAQSKLLWVLAFILIVSWIFHSLYIKWEIYRGAIPPRGKYKNFSFRIFNTNSNFEDGKLSRRYAFRIWLIAQKLKIGALNINRYTRFAAVITLLSVITVCFAWFYFHGF